MSEVREHRDVPAGAPPINYHREVGVTPSSKAGGEIEKSQYADGKLSKSFEKGND